MIESNRVSGAGQLLLLWCHRDCSPLLLDSQGETVYCPTSTLTVWGGGVQQLHPETSTQSTRVTLYVT